jgi:hypothetical protein
MTSQNYNQEIINCINQAKKILNALDLSRYSCDRVNDVGAVIGELSSVQYNISSALCRLSLSVTQKGEDNQ